MKKNRKFLRGVSLWTGVLLDRKHRTGMSDLYLLLIVKDSLGQTPRKRILRKIDALQTEETEPFDIAHINADWFKNIPKEFAL